jgi:DNA-binding MarR family transcriptional regulator
VKRELVERFDDNSDRRIVRIRLSTSGRMLADNLHQQHLGRMNKVFSGLSDEELHVMLSVLSRLTQQFNDQKHAEGGE